MKNLMKNKKGFTLIELLAVIVILAILVMVAIPAVTKYLTAARQGTFADNARSAISAVRNDVIMNGMPSDGMYDLGEIDLLLEKKLNTSPFGGAYDPESKIVVTQTGDGNGNYTYTYSMCLFEDENGAGAGFTMREENEIDASIVEPSGVTSCNPPSDTPTT